MTRAASSTTIPTVTPAQTLAAGAATVIDLRTSAEFALDHLPGARNLPLFRDAERAVIGTLYKRSSPGAAFEEGARLARERACGLVQEIVAAAGAELSTAEIERRFDELVAGGIGVMEASLAGRPLERVPEDAVVLHCWRGGLRSKSVIALLRSLGFERAVGLAGGYKAYRADVLARLAGWQAPPVYMLRGLTGVGKSLVLRALEALRPGWTVDLEQLAGHRSSILGMVGLEPCTQKTFDTRLAERLAQGFEGPAVFEGESRKVGDVIVPESVWNAMEGGVGLRLVASTARRVEVLVEDYLARDDSRRELRDQLPFIEERLGPVKWKGRLVALLDAGREGELVELLLEHYYDPLYRHSESRHTITAEFDSSDPEGAGAEIAAWIDAQRTG